MARRVKGTLFVDYVRMIRSRKGVDWAKYLEPEDLPFLEQTIEPKSWYPMESFERLGNAVLQEIAGGDLGFVRSWGQASLEALQKHPEELIVPDDPRESLMRVRVFRNSFFDYEVVTIDSLSDGDARITVGYGMRQTSEVAAAFQTLGFFERLLTVAGGRQVEASFISRSWEGDATTVVELRWR